MWILFWMFIMTVSTVFLYKLFGEFVKAFCISAIVVVLTFYLSVIGNELRIRNKFDSYENNLLEHFEPIYESRDYCYLTTDNYTEERRFIINKTTFPKRVEYKLSGRTFYHFELYTTDINKPFESIVIEDKHLKLILIDGVVPCYKKIIKYVETDIPGGLNWALPQECFEIKTAYHCGTLYLPNKPIYKENIIPQFLEYDILKSYETMNAIN